MSVVLKHHIDDEVGQSGIGVEAKAPLASTAAYPWPGTHMGGANSGGGACAHERRRLGAARRRRRPPKRAQAAEAANGAPPPPPAAENGAVVVDPNVERGLARRCASSTLQAGGFPSERDEAQITRAELMRLKRAGLAMNQAITRVAQARNAREDRYIIELHLLLQILQREATDRDANRARVYEMLRKNLTTDDAASAAAASSSAAASGSANPLNAPSAASLAVDKAFAAVGRIDASLQALSANGTSTVHGAAGSFRRTMRARRLLKELAIGLERQYRPPAHPPWGGSGRSRSRPATKFCERAKLRARHNGPFCSGTQTCAGEGRVHGCQLKPHAVSIKRSN